VRWRADFAACVLSQRLEAVQQARAARTSQVP